MDDLSAARPRQHQPNQLEEDEGRPARDVAPGECWAFLEHRTMAEVIVAESERGQIKRYRILVTC
jgi:hypothetical protein